MSTDPTFSARVADEVRAMIYRLNLNKSELARRLGVSHTWVTNRLAGHQQIGLDELERIASALEVPITDLIPTNQPAGKPRGGSLPADNWSPTPTRTAELTLGRGTPTLADPPSMTPIRSATEQAVTAGRISRPTRLSTTPAGGETR